MELFEPTPESRIVAAIVVKLTPQYGGITVSNGVYTFHDVAKPPDSVIANAREQVIYDLNARAIKDECSLRILRIMKDTVTEMNINAWVLDIVARQANPVSGELPTQEELNDVTMSRHLKQWVADMQAASRTLIEAMDPTYANDNHWPVPPAGAKDFVDRF